VEDAHEIGARREEDPGGTGSPGEEGGAVVAEELHQLAEGLDAAPLVSTGEAGVEAAARLMAMGSVEGALGEDPRDAEESPSLRSQVGGGGGLPGGEGVLEGSSELVG
jgi:hypothetical protein